MISFSEVSRLKEFEQIYNEYHKRVFSFLYKVCKNYSLAEELTQETFYQAFKSYGKFKGNSDLFTWLASIAKHTYFKYLKKNRLGIEALDLDAVGSIYISDSSDLPELAYEKQDMIACLRRKIKEMPQKYSDVVILRIYADMSFKQVADALGISEGSAKVIFLRAKKMLAEELKDEMQLR